jgi:hypothetical protein
MARVLGYGGLGNSRARDFSGRAEAEDDGGALHFRSNDFNRRRYGGLWGHAMVFLALMRVQWPMA